MSSTTFEIKSFRKASSFLNALRLSKAVWWEYHDLVDDADRSWQRGWFFRGQASSDWLLTPTAWRKPEKKEDPDYIQIAKTSLSDPRAAGSAIHDSLKRKWDVLGKPAPTDGEFKNTGLVLLQALAEKVVINEFMRLASDIGYRIPNWTDWTPPAVEFIDKYVNGINAKQNDAIWMHPIVALAQHHQVPTRLLDWTRNPLCAAFFAAVEAADKPNPKKKIAVFAIHQMALQDHIKLVKIPGSEIDFLRAQGGVFTYDSLGDKLFIKNGQYPSLETSIENIPRSIHPKLKTKKPTLPQTEAPELIRLLWLEGITQAHLMPTLDNVSSALKTRWRLIK